jgi:glycosyltransferase involved in cell wall biosynthesis
VLAVATIVTGPVSVVISSYEEGHALSDTIDAVLAATVTPREVVIVDDGSTDGSCGGPWPAAVRVVRQSHQGIAPARNRGASVATQPNLVFLDAHCTVEPGWLGPLLGVLERSADALAGPAVRDADEPRFVGVGAQLVDAQLRYRWRPVSGAEVVDVGLVPGGCLAVGRDRFLQAGGFGPFDGVGVEDVELALRWWRAGRPMLGVPASVVTHRFRARSSYRTDEQAWLQNVLRTGLLHLQGSHLRDCVTSCARFAPFACAIATVLSEPWHARHQALLTTQVRDVASYIECWAPCAFSWP